MKKFMEPEIDIIRMTLVDVITTSDEQDDGGNNPGTGDNDLGWG